MREIHQLPLPFETQERCIRLGVVWVASTSVDLEKETMNDCETFQISTPVSRISVNVKTKGMSSGHARWKLNFAILFDKERNRWLSQTYFVVLTIETFLGRRSINRTLPLFCLVYSPILYLPFNLSYVFRILPIFDRLKSFPLGFKLFARYGEARAIKLSIADFNASHSLIGSS